MGATGKPKKIVFYTRNASNTYVCTLYEKEYSIIKKKKY